MKHSYYSTRRADQETLDVLRQITLELTANRRDRNIPEPQLWEIVNIAMAIGARQLRKRLDATRQIELSIKEFEAARQEKRARKAALRRQEQAMEAEQE